MQKTTTPSKENKNISDKKKIIDYLTELFPREGFYSTSMDEIASELMMSKKTIYKLFPSKSILVNKVFDSMIEFEAREIDKILKSKENVITKFINLFELYTNISSTISNKWQRDIKLHAPEVQEKFHKFTSENIYDMLGKLIRQGKKEKLIQNYPNELIIELHIILARYLFSPDFFLEHKNFTMKDVFNFVFDSQLNGVLSEKGRELYNKNKYKPFSNKNLKYA